MISVDFWPRIFILGPRQLVRQKNKYSLPPGHATYENTENTRQETTGVDFKVNLRKVVKKPANLEEDSSSAKPNSQILDFKSNLRKKSDQSEKSTSGSKADPQGAAATTTNTESSPIVDFKAKLRKSTKPDITSANPITTKEDNTSANNGQLISE